MRLLQSDFPQQTERCKILPSDKRSPLSGQGSQGSALGTGSFSWPDSRVLGRKTGNQNEERPKSSRLRALHFLVAGEGFEPPTSGL